MKVLKKCKKIHRIAQAVGRKVKNHTFAITAIFALAAKKKKLIIAEIAVSFPANDIKNG